jgi:hypothetical protein
MGEEPVAFFPVSGYSFLISRFYFPSFEIPEAAAGILLTHMLIKHGKERRIR